MMNTMNKELHVKSLVTQYVSPRLYDVLSPYQAACEVTKNDVLVLLTALKNNGFTQLSYLSAVDWIDENKFEMIYILMNWELAYHLQIRTKIDREMPEIASVISVFPGARYYERECYEFFGVHFPGNPEYHKQLILENWDSIPPLRKDFDPKAYSDQKFPTREYEVTYVQHDPNDKTLHKQATRKTRAQSLRGDKQ